MLKDRKNQRLFKRFEMQETPEARRPSKRSEERRAGTALVPNMAGAMMFVRRRRLTFFYSLTGGRISILPPVYGQ
jgi:hypothetical protein